MRFRRRSGSGGMPARVLPGLLALATAGLGSPQRCMAEAWLLDGKISQQFEFDDNIRLTREPQNVVGAVTTPSVVISRRTNELSVVGTGQVEAAHFFGDSDLDYVNQRASVEAQHPMERGAVSFASAVSRESTLISEFGDTGLADVNGRRLSYNFQPGFQYNLSRLDTISFDVGYTNVSYYNVDLIDYKYYSADLSWSHLLTRRFTLTASSSATYYKSADFLDTKTQIYGGQAGVTWLPTEHWSGSLSGGLRYVTSKTSAPEFLFFNPSQGSSLGFLFNANISYAAPHWHLDLIAQRSVDPSGYGSTVERDLAQGNIRHQFREHMWIYLSGYFQRDHRGGGLGGRDRRYYAIEPGIRWELSRNLGLKAAYRYRAQELDSPSRRTDSNNVSLTLTYDFDQKAF